MTKIDIMNIVPAKFVEQFDSENKGHMLFAHLVGDNEYTKQYRKISGTKILDNSWWELRRNLPIKTLISKAHEIKADVLVLPDTDFKRGFEVTINRYLKEIRDIDRSIKVMGVVKGDSFTSELECFKFFNVHPKIDMIAVPYQVRVYDEWCRKDFMDMIDRSGVKVNLPVHLFGVNNLLTLEDEMRSYVVSADTTLAFKCGMNNIKLPIHPKDDPKRPENYFGVDRIDMRMERIIRQNIEWLKEKF